jgi:dTDP-4-dehydrorhamnose 3,5-epimerase
MGFAHGFQTLEDESTVFYQMSEFYVPESSRGLRYNDPLLNIDWPLPVGLINERDRSYPDYSRERFPELS